MNRAQASDRLWTETRGDGPDLFLVHGWGLNAGVWSLLVEELVGRYRVTVVDLPGHGHSRFTGTTDLHSLADDLLTVAPERAFWVGWSLGGMAALAAAVQRPERITGLLLTAAGPRFTRVDGWPDAVPRGVLGSFAADLEADFHGTLNRFLALQVRGSDDASATLRLLKQDLFSRGEPTPDALAAGLDLLRNGDLLDRLSDYPGPVRFVMGERDALNPPAAAETTASRMQQAQVTVIPGAGHAPFLSHRDDFLRILNEFISDHAREKDGDHADG